MTTLHSFSTVWKIYFTIKCTRSVSQFHYWSKIHGSQFDFNYLSSSVSFLWLWLNLPLNHFNVQHLLLHSTAGSYWIKRNESNADTENHTRTPINQWCVSLLVIYSLQFSCCCSFTSMLTKLSTLELMQIHACTSNRLSSPFLRSRLTSHLEHFFFLQNKSEEMKNSQGETKDNENCDTKKQ